MNLADPNAPNNVVDFTVGSIPANYGYDESFSKEDDANESQFKPRILIMGLRRQVPAVCPCSPVQADFLQLLVTVCRLPFQER